jgi:hypothetical protein
VLALGAVVAGGLSGCSATSGSLSAASGIAIGQQAIGFTSSDSTSSTGWSSDLGCPDGFKEGFTSSLPAGSTVVTLDPESQSGVLADPSVTAGDIPNCALKLETSQASITALVFLNMDQTHQSAIISKLEADGFVGAAVEATTDGTQQEFDKGAVLVEIGKINADGVSAFAVMG